MTVYTCPNCESDELVVRSVTSYNFNTGDFFCHSVKTHDSDAEVACLDCGWVGQRQDFKEQNE